MHRNIHELKLLQPITSPCMHAWPVGLRHACRRWYRPGMLTGREFQGQGQEPQGQGQGQRSRLRSNSIVMACNCSLVQNSNINYCVRGGHKPAHWPWPTSRLTETEKWSWIRIRNPISTKIELLLEVHPLLPPTKFGGDPWTRSWYILRTKTVRTDRQTHADDHKTLRPTARR